MGEGVPPRRAREVFVADEQSAEPVDARKWAALASQVLGAEGVSAMEMSMMFVDEEAIAALNQRFLDRKGPTDVLAFPIDDDMIDLVRLAEVSGPAPGPGGRRDPDDLPGLLGDVIICPSVARTNAEARGRSVDDEVALLVVHGILHLLGMDHVDDAEAEAMEKREQELLERFYHRSADRAQAAGHD